MKEFEEVFDIVERDSYRNEYKEWLFKKVLDNHNVPITASNNYSKLLNYLYNVEFTYCIPMDENRELDGMDMRYTFCYECGYTNSKIVDEYLCGPCRLLEMMIALAIRLENGFANDSKYGDRSSLWFWSMVTNMGLSKYSDNCFDANIEVVEEAVYNMLERHYDKYGHGALFTVKETDYDFSKEELWFQGISYINEHID